MAITSTKKYKVREGFTFRDDSGKIAGGGDTIELADDIAQLHLHKLESLEEPKERKAATKPKAAGAPADDPAGTAGAASDSASAADPAGDGTTGDGAQQPGE